MAAGSATIHILPLDVVLRIFSELSTKDRASLPYVCKTWAVWLKTSGMLHAMKEGFQHGMSSIVAAEIT